MSLIRNIYLHDGEGNPIGSHEGAINIHDADVHRFIVSKKFGQSTATSTTLAADVSSGATQITLTSATGFAVGNHLRITGQCTENICSQITVLAGNVATLDRPLDNSYLSGDSVTKMIPNMGVLGTLASPESFKVIPPADEVWHLAEMLIEMTHGTAGDNGLFGDLTALTNGVVLRKYDGTTSSYLTFTLWKTNSDIVLDMYNIIYAARSGGGGSYGTNAKASFKNTGAIVYLNGIAGDYLEILVQDDLTGLDSFRIKVQGHKESA